MVAANVLRLLRCCGDRSRVFSATRKRSYGKNWFNLRKTSNIAEPLLAADALYHNENFNNLNFDWL